VASRQDRHKRAAVLFGAASAIWESLASSPANYPTFCELHDRYVGLSRSALGSAAYDSAFRQGREMTGDAALDLALEEGPDEDEPEPPPNATVRPAGSLTRREQQIAELIADGMTNREIAQHLVIAVRTAEGHVEHILSKLGFSSRAQIAAWVASRRGGPPDEA
jgi:non-specific serine/threonine protein kinase